MEKIYSLNLWMKPTSESYFKRTPLIKCRISILSYEPFCSSAYTTPAQNSFVCMSCQAGPPRRVAVWS